jgi:hypothetical protein
LLIALLSATLSGCAASNVLLGAYYLNDEGPASISLRISNQDLGISLK